MDVKKNNLLFLDGLRGFAAFYVMTGHARWLLWEGHESYLSNQTKYSIADKSLMWFFSIFKFGHEFVLFFFVLSGFVIHLKYAKSLKQDFCFKFNWLDYFTKRSKRIYPPFIFALILTAALDFIGNRINPVIYTGTTHYLLINRNVGNPNHSLTTFCGNLFFLYTQYVPVFGTNGPSWSLKYEWWFYLFYPFFLLFGRRNIIYPTLLVIVLYILSIIIPNWPVALLQEVFGGMLAWWLGVLISEIFIGRIKIDLKYMIILSLVLSMILISTHKPQFHDLSIALLFSGILTFLLLLSEKGKSLSYCETLKPLGDISYTLYITHFPILVFCSSLLLKYKNNILPASSYFIIAGILICLVSAYAFSFITERPFVRKNAGKLTLIIGGNPI